MKIELPISIAENIKYFTGRTWLLPRLLSWLEQSDQRTFVLTGGPGTGKSMIVAWLAGAGPAPTDPAAGSQLEQLRSQVAAVHFCISASRNTSPRAVAENLANQLKENIQEFGAALAATAGGRVQITVTTQVDHMTGGNITGVSIGRLDLGGLSDEDSFNYAFTKPINKLYQEGYDKTIILLIDALDEAQTYTGSLSLLQLLSEQAYLPTRVRFILTTRPDPRVFKFIQSVPGADLIVDAPADAADVHTYIAQRLASEAPGLEVAKRNLLAARVAEVARGVFLYGHMVLGDLLTHLPDVPDLETYPLPEGLSNLYRTFLNRELGSNEDRWYETIRPLLGLIAVSRWSGLTQTLLSRIIGKEVELPLRLCKQYLAGDLPEGPFRIFDRSFTDFLLEDKENRDYHINAQEMHRRITEYYIQNYSRNWSRCDSYGINHLVEHALASGLDDQERKDTFNRILTDEFVSAIQERTGWLYAFIEDLEALALVEPDWAARLCFALVLDRPPNSLVIQHALRLLVRLRPATGPVGRAGTPRDQGLDKIVQIMGDNSGNVPNQLMELLQHETNARVRGAIALALAETGNPEVASCLLGMFKNEFGEASWAAADALIALNHRPVIPELIQWFLELKAKNDRRSTARKQRIIYVLGWMHAQEAKVLKPIALTASDAKIVGRAVDLTWLLQPEGGDESYLRAQLQRILASAPDHPEELGPWADDWLQKRLVRAFSKLGVAEILPDMRRLLEHIRSRPAPKPATRRLDFTQIRASKRARLVEAVEEAITELQIGR